MRSVIQRVSQASVTVSGKTVGKIGFGLVVFVATTHSDTQADVDFIIKKICHLRIMSNAQGKMNLSVQDIKGEILVVSQFTLYAHTRKGHRPSFIKAAPRSLSEPLYNSFVHQLKATGITIATGQFGALMQVSLINDGPVTIIIDSHD